MPIIDGKHINFTGGRSSVQMERFSNNFKFLFIKNLDHNPILGKVNLPIVVEDLKIRELLKRELSNTGLSKIEIEHLPSEAGGIKITIYSNKNCSDEKLKRLMSELKKMTERDVIIAIQKIRGNLSQNQSLKRHESIWINENKVYSEKRKIIYPKFLKQKERKRI